MRPQMSQQLKSLSDPNVQEVDGSDAAQFIAAAAALANRDLATPFMAAAAGAWHASRTTPDSGRAPTGATTGSGAARCWSSSKSAYPDTDAMKACEMSNWRRPSAGSTMSMCNSGWAYPPLDFNKKGGDLPSCSPARTPTSAAHSTGTTRPTPPRGREQKGGGWPRVGGWAVRGLPGSLGMIGGGASFGLEPRCGRSRARKRCGARAFGVHSAGLDLMDVRPGSGWALRPAYTQHSSCSAPCESY